MNRNKAFLLSIFISLMTFFILLIPQAAQGRSNSAVEIPQLQATAVGPEVGTAPPAVSGAVHAYYFYANDCPHCIVILDEIIEPMLNEYGDLFDIRLLELGNPRYYEALIQIEDYFNIEVGEKGLPTLVIGDQILIGEDPVRENLAQIVQKGLDEGGIDFPTIEGIDPQALISVTPAGEGSDEICVADNGDTCATDAPIYAAYFYQVGCKECSRIETDLKYLQSIYPQLIIEEFNVYDEAALGDWLSMRAGRAEDFLIPAVFIGDYALIGEEELAPENIEVVLIELISTGAAPIWLEYDQESGLQNIIGKFSSMGWLTVVLAGLIDGLNPCAFATLVFFVSYLTLSGRKGKEILVVGTAFTLGVFLAYLAVGLGLHKLFDLMGGALNIAGQIVYGITALICLGLAIFSLRDYFKARKGDIGDMTMNLPEPLRKRINVAIRKGRHASSYVIGSFITGILISFLELACTGQIYLPTIIFVSSIPEMRLQAITYLILYNLLFILPLIVVFILAYYGTTSKDLTKFLKDNAAAVKLGMALVFLILAVWLGTSIFL